MNEQQQEDLQRDVFAGLLSALLVVVGQLALRFMFPPLPDMVSLFLSLAFWVILFLPIRRRSPLALLRSRPAHVVVLALIVVLVVPLANFIYSKLLERRAVYLLIDASEQMQSRLRELAPQLALAEIDSASRVDLGVAAFGGHLTFKTGCDDIAELVGLTPASEGVSSVGQAAALLAAIEPQGRAPLHEAVLFALERLRGREGLNRIIVITSGIDANCAALDRAQLESRAAQNAINFEIQVFADPTTNPQDLARLTAYSNGNLVLMTDSEQLPLYLQPSVEFSPPRYWYWYLLQP